MKPQETLTDGPRSPLTSDVVSRVVAQLIERLGTSIGRIEPWREQNRWADLSDALGNRVGRVSIRSVLNGAKTRLDLLFHGMTALGSCITQQPLALQDSGGKQSPGTWQQAMPSICRFTVDKHRTVTLTQAQVPPVPSAEAAAQNVHSVTLDELEHMQECLEGVRKRKGKRFH